MQNKQSLQKLVEYFRNFTFDSLHIRVQRGNRCKFCQQEKTNYTDNKECVQQLQNSVLNGRKMASQFQERVHQLLMENERLEEEIGGLREEMRDQKQDYEKMMEESSNIIQVLRAELIDKEDFRRHLLEKQQQTKSLIEQLSHLQNQLQLTQHQLRKYQLQGENHFEIKQQSNPLQLEHYQQQIRTINQNLQLSNLSNQSLINTITQLQTQIRVLTQNKNVHQKHILSSHHQQNQTQKQHQNHLLLPSINFYSTYSNQLIDLPSFQNQNLNQMYSQQPHETFIHSSSVLKDLLNSLQQPYREQTFINHLEKNTKQTLIPKQTQKQNIYKDSNQQSVQLKEKHYRIDSSQKLLTKQKVKINQEITVLSSKKQFKLHTQYSIKVDEHEHYSIKVDEHEHQYIEINENQTNHSKWNICSDMNKSRFEQKYSDPYYSFFMLTGQCIKINSLHLEQIAGVDVEKIWEEVIEKRIPMNEWNSYLQSQIYLQAGLIVEHN